MKQFRILKSFFFKSEQYASTDFGLGELGTKNNYQKRNKRTINGTITEGTLTIGPARYMQQKMKKKDFRELGRKIKDLGQGLESRDTVLGIGTKKEH